MRRLAGIFFTLFFLAAPLALADTLVYKTGENIKGKILDEDDAHVLFKREDGLVVDVPRSKITIVDKDIVSDAAPQGAVNVFTEAPNKKPYKLLVVGDSSAPESPRKKASSDASANSPGTGSNISFEAIAKFIEKWLADHPEIEEKMKDFLDRSKGGSDELEKMAKALQ